MKPFLLLFFSFMLAGNVCAQPRHTKPPIHKNIVVRKFSPPALDHSGEVRRGKASFYGKEFYGRLMADGTPMNPSSHIAASRTLPLGTKVEVKNLLNGKTEVVEIKDRGPYVADRIIDLSPTVADKLGMRERGVVAVEVRPLQVPQADGSMKHIAALETNRHWLASAE